MAELMAELLAELRRRGIVAPIRHGRPPVLLAGFSRFLYRDLPWTGLTNLGFWCSRRLAVPFLRHLPFGRRSFFVLHLQSCPKPVLALICFVLTSLMHLLARF